MIPARLLQQAVIILRAPETPDRYGTPVQDWDNATQTLVRGLLQTRAGTEDELGRSQQTSDAVLYLAPDTDITGRDRVMVDGRVYHVLGPPQPVNRLATPHHLVAEVRAVEG